MSNAMRKTYVASTPQPHDLSSSQSQSQQQQQGQVVMTMDNGSEQDIDDDDDVTYCHVQEFKGSNESGGTGGGMNNTSITNAHLNSWFSTMKDDIDGGLAADFDGSLSGLGVEMGTSSYNMSEALLALPAVFKHEGEDTGFQYVLMAPTSPATKINEETLTYLNQGQSYEVRLKKHNSISCNNTISMQQSHTGLFRSVVRVVFHERRLQFMEREQLDTWRKTRPGERIVDIDIPLSYGLSDVNVNPRKLNSVEIVWDHSKDVALFIKVHCISTEFTARKHGGEKGVPFRVQVETYANNDQTNQLLHCASCQVKVFKTKGADRKNKTDREKVEKRPDTEKVKYQPSYECTVLTEIPLEHVETYLEQLKKQEEEDDVQDRKKQKDVRNFSCISDTSNSMSSESPHSGESTSPAEKMSSSLPFSIKGRNGSSTALKIKTESSVKSSPRLKSSPPGRELAFKSRKGSDGTARRSSGGPQTSPKITTDTGSRNPDRGQNEGGILTWDTNADEVCSWLKTNRFSAFLKVFANFSGADLLKLSREDLIQICGLADGIRLNNSLQHKQIRPKLTIYICQPSRQKGHTVNPDLNNPSNVLDIGQIHISNQPSTSTAQISAVIPPPIVKYTSKQLEEFNVYGFETSNSNPFSLSDSTMSQDRFNFANISNSSNAPISGLSRPLGMGMSSTSGPSSSTASNMSTGRSQPQRQQQQQARSIPDAIVVVSKISTTSTPIHNVAMKTERSSPQIRVHTISSPIAVANGLPPSFTIPQTEINRNVTMTGGEIVDRSPSNSPSPPNNSPPRLDAIVDHKDACIMVGPGGDRQTQYAQQELLQHMYQQQQQQKQQQSKTATISHSSKRQFQEEDNSNDSTSGYFSKKARTRNLEVKRKDIYHAVFLDELGLAELKEHLCGLLCVPTAAVSEIVLLQQSGIRVLVTDHVVQNLPDNSRFIINGTQDDSVESICYKVELTHVQ